MPHPDHRSPSSMCQFVRCPRKYFYGRIMSLERSSTGRDLAMRFGSALHAAAPYTHRRDLDGAFKAFDGEWKDGDDYGDKKRTKRTANAIIAEMCRVHGPECPYEPLTPADVGLKAKDPGMNEVEFSVDIGLTSGKPLTGIIDTLGRVRSTQAIAVVDYKSASQIWGSFGELFALSPQIQTYVMASRVMGVDVQAAFVEGILVSAGRVSITLVPLEIVEDVQDAMLDWWRSWDHRVEMCEQWEDSETNPLRWEQNFCGCNPYACFGCQGFECEFDPLCSAGRNWRELVGTYQVRVEKGKGKGEDEA